jgi:Transposase DDE domain group 1
LLAYRELDDALALTEIAITKLLDGRRGKNTRHKLGGLFRQSVFGRLAGYDDVNDAERLARDPAMRAIIGREGLERLAASSSQIGRVETEWLASDANLAALMDLPGAWIDQVHERKPPGGIVLDMDSSKSPTPGQQEGSAWNGHFGCTCYHSLFVFNQYGDLERSLLRAGHVHSAEDRRGARGHPLHGALAGQAGLAAADRPPPDAAGGTASQEADRDLRQLPLSAKGWSRLVG